MGVRVACARFVISTSLLVPPNLQNKHAATLARQPLRNRPVLSGRSCCSSQSRHGDQRLTGRAQSKRAMPPPNRNPRHDRRWSLPGSRRLARLGAGDANRARRRHHRKGWKLRSEERRRIRHPQIPRWHPRHLGSDHGDHAPHRPFSEHLHSANISAISEKT